MKRVLRVARTEVLEHRRQPSMILILLANYILWAIVFLVIIAVLGMAAETPQILAVLQQQAASLGDCSAESALNAMTKVSASTFGAVLFTNLPLFVAIMSGYSVLHDRSSGALPFLMLAPLSRYQLLLGKLLGAMVIPVALHLIFVGIATVAARQFDVLAPFDAQFGGAPAWWVAYLLGAPASAFLVGSIGTVISGLSRDVRTSMQFTSFVIGILSLGFGFVLFDGIAHGTPFQFGFVAGALACGLLVLLAGSKIISRDIGR